MLRNSERTVLQFDVRMEGSAAGGRNGAISGLTPLSMKAAMQLVKRLFDKGDLLSRQDRSETITWYLADVEVTSGYASLLINRSDKGSADFVLSEPRARRRRVIQKRGGEGADYSAHVVINLNAFGPNMYRASVEHCPGLSISRLEFLLNLILRTCGKEYRDEMMRPHPNGSVEKDGSPKQVVLRNRLIFSGHPSDALLRELQSGKVESMVLIDQRQRTRPWDSNGYIIEDVREVKLKVNPAKILMAIRDTIKSVCKEADSKHWGRLRVRFQTVTGINRSVLFDTSNASVLDEDRYIKKEVLKNFSAPLTASVEKLHPEIVRGMKLLAR